MPKNGRNGGGAKGDSCLFPFHMFISTTLTAGAFTAAASPNASVSPRGLIEADTWAFFRIRKLAMRLHPPASITAAQLVGYCGAVQDVTPSGATQVGELISSAILGGDATVPTEWVRPSKSELAGPLDWYKAIPGAADATEESPGIIIVSGNGTDAVLLEIRGVFEFKVSVNAANSPLAMAARKAAREERVRAIVAGERDALLKILGASGTPPAKPTATLP